MRIISWNVNGLRATYKNGHFEDLFSKRPQTDIFCFQETKVEEEQLSEDIRNVPGYKAFFASSKVKKGYSGVAFYIKENIAKRIQKIEYSIDKENYDKEGRVLIIYFDTFVLINCYFPNGGGGPERLRYKLDFYDKFLEYINTIIKKNPNVIFCGDVNTAHEEIDLARSKENEKNTGFLPEERAWLDEVIDNGWIDVFRNLYPNTKDAYTYWDMKTRARDRNVGWRIDYFFISPPLLSKVNKIEHLKDQYGSDHCPLHLDISL